ncbi:MAG: hypothetical protein J6J35_05330 [Alphaproteobacteria bacterium]|nr:hypothetical protein [Alphaproteobacteria bacterium]MBP3687767.1 hypothetical protein [Alphaproteobacteria bacterium]
MKKINILKNVKREVVCVREEEVGPYFPNADKVQKGKVYHLKGIRPFDRRIEVLLEEFPGLHFNVVQFNEIR